MNKSTLFRLVVTTSLMGWIGWKTDWPAVHRAFVNLDVWCWLGAVGVLLIAQTVSAVRWRIFARQLGLERSVIQLTRYYLIGMYFNLLLPTSVGGDVVRIWYLDGNSGRKLRAAAATMLDRINGLIVLVVLASTAVLFAPAGTPTWVPLSVFAIAGAGVFVVAALVAFVRWGRLNEHRRQQLSIMWEVIRHPRSLMWTTILSLLVQIASAAIVWLIGRGLGLDIPVGYYAVFVPMVSLLTLLPISVNGMGLREGGTALFLAPLGIAATSAYTLAFLWFAAQIAVSVVGGVVYLFAHEKSVPAEPPAADPNIADTEGNHGPVDRDSHQGRTRQLDCAA